MKFKYGPHYGIDVDFYCMVYATLRTCPAVQRRALELCAEIAGDHAAALYECVTTGESLPDVERRHDLPLNTLQKYTPALYRRLCGENVGIWTPQQLPEWSRSTSQKRHKTATKPPRETTNFLDVRTRKAHCDS